MNDKEGRLVILNELLLSIRNIINIYRRSRVLINSTERPEECRLLRDSFKFTSFSILLIFGLHYSYVFE